MGKISAGYESLLTRALRHPAAAGGAAALVFVLSAGVVPFLGAEFLPRLDEGSILVMMYRVPGISLHESLHGNEIIETVLKQFPEVDKVVCRTGRPEVAVDPMAIDQSDVYVMLKPVKEWTTGRTKGELVTAMQKALEKEAPGAAYSFMQPIEMRMQELMEAGVRSDIAVKLYGEDMDVLRDKAQQIVKAVERVPGAVDVRAERVAGLPYLRVKVKREAIARHGLDAEDVLSTVEAIQNLKVGDSEGHFIPLAQLADVWEEEGPAQVSRENAQRRISVEVNVRGRDLARFVSEARRAVAREVKIPEGYSVEWGGQFERLASASRRLAVTTPAALLLIIVLLYLNFGAVRPAGLIFLNVPLAATGGVLALWGRGMPFSISAGVGLIALFGSAVLNGIVLLAVLSHAR